MFCNVAAGPFQLRTGVEPATRSFGVCDDPVAFVVGVGSVGIVEVVPGDNFQVVE